MGHCLSRCWLLILAVVLVSACDGGLMGTSTGPGQAQESGPKVVKGELPRLPKKISPRLPGSITGTTQAGTAASLQTRSVKADQQSDQPQTASRSWALLQPSIQEIETTRIAVQEVLILLDREHESILSACEDSLQLTEQCVVESGDIESFYDDVVTQQMIAVYQTANAGTPATDIVENIETSQIRTRYTDLEGSSVVFNQILIQMPTTDDQAYRLTTSTDGLLQGRTLRLSWNGTYDQITYDLFDEKIGGDSTFDSNNTEGSIEELYNYRNNVTGQQLTVQRSIKDADNLQTFSIEVTAQSEDTGDVFYNARVDDIYLTGQAGDETAYAYTRDVEAEDGGYFQEIFDEFGYLIAIQECFSDPGNPCNEDEIEDVFLDFYLSEEEYDEVIDGFGFDDVMVVNLPADVFEFLIVENAPDVPLLWREEFCDGWQPEPGDVELFCYVHDFELDDAVVVSIDGGNFTLIPGARVIVEGYQP